jgi:hypothetical protein
MARLQGLPETFLDEAPFTMDGKRMVIGNGVPLQMGRPLARAIREALDDRARGSVTEGLSGIQPGAASTNLPEGTER